MKKTMVLPAMAGALLLTACTHNAIDEFQEVGPSETAFLIALDGDTMKNQSRLQSVEFLEKNKVSDKRVMIPHRMVNLCPSCWWGQYQDMPSAKLIRISRAPVTREWTRSGLTGTSASNQAFSVETSESIDFDIGATMTAHINETDAAKFLYFYAGKQLAEVADSNIRSFVAASLARQFGANTLDWCRAHKNEVFANALKEAQDAFAPKGIAIDNLGFVEGMTYHDQRIQDAINKKFEADVQVEAARQQLAAAETLAKAQTAVQAQQELEMKKRALDLQAKAIDKWDGHLPQVVGSDSKLMLGMGDMLRK
ncbi:SPFH domain-containing protein [uncultured Aquitalea sp.]|uniref:SPFH domain-containing protein n=1 Tax=uncultured Aquitalea sp. TaxID=540272 RepID=UPI0025FB97E1|nr:SPFH domain-containing protein [uncultured Aquitalea sp.]